MPRGKPAAKKNKRANIVRRRVRRAGLENGAMVVGNHIIEPFVSEQGRPKYPGMTESFKRSLPYYLEPAFRNLFTPWAVNGQPAPADCNSKQMCAASANGYSPTMYNGYTGAASFAAFVIQTGNPLYPSWITNAISADKAVLLDSAAEGNEAQGASIDCGASGQAFGLLQGSIAERFVAVLSNTADKFTNSPNVHGWFISVQGIALKQFQLTAFLSSNVINGTITVYSVNLATNTLTSVGTYFIAGGTSNATLGVPSATVDTYFVTININDEQFSPCKISLAIYNTTDSSYQPMYMTNFKANLNPPYYAACNLVAVQTNNFSNIEKRSNTSRVNSASLVLTNTTAELYKGGNILSAKVSNNFPPPGTWDSYLYDLPTKRLGPLSEGICSMWFPSSNEILLHDAGARNTNPFMYSDSMVNMHYLTNTAVSGQTNDSLAIQVKVDLGIDYDTSDTTIPNVMLIARNDDWVTLVSMVSHFYRFTDNPTHKEYLSLLKTFVTKVFKSDEEPYKIVRTLGKGIGSAALTALTAAAALI